jgi:hypothetical protein
MSLPRHNCQQRVPHTCYHEAPQLQQERQNIAPPFPSSHPKEKGVNLYALPWNSHTRSPYFLAFFIILIFFSSGIFLPQHLLSKTLSKRLWSLDSLSLLAETPLLRSLCHLLQQAKVTTGIRTFYWRERRPFSSPNFLFVDCNPVQCLGHKVVRHAFN